MPAGYTWKILRVLNFPATIMSKYSTSKFTNINHRTRLDHSNVMLLRLCIFIGNISSHSQKRYPRVVWDKHFRLSTSNTSPVASVNYRKSKAKVNFSGTSGNASKVSSISQVPFVGSLNYMRTGIRSRNH